MGGELFEDKSVIGRINFAKVKNYETSTETKGGFVATIKWKCPTGKRGEIHVEETRRRDGNWGTKAQRSRVEAMALVIRVWASSGTSRMRRGHLAIRRRTFTESFHYLGAELCRDANSVVEDVDLAQVCTRAVRKGGSDFDQSGILDKSPKAANSSQHHNTINLCKVQ
jgi:hypothetical protein